MPNGKDSDSKGGGPPTAASKPAGVVTAAPTGTPEAVSAALAATLAAPVAAPTALAAPTKAPPKYTRPAFLDALSDAYSDRGKKVVILSGDTHDLFWCPAKNKFLDLEQSLYAALSPMFTVTRFDSATGVGFYKPQDLELLAGVCKLGDERTSDASRRVGELAKMVKAARHEPLPALVLLGEILESVISAKSNPESGSKVQPVCTIVRFSGSLFPQGDFDKMNEIDRQRLVEFLNMIEAPWFKESNHLLILVCDTLSEINKRIVAQPSAQAIEIDLPNAVERAMFVDTFLEAHASKPVTFEKSKDDFLAGIAGLTLPCVEDLLEAASRTGQPLTRKQVLAELNRLVKALLGSEVTIRVSTHGPEDVVDYADTGPKFIEFFESCEDPETALPAILIPGPNGGGKTYQAEAYGGGASGRIVLELTGLRGMWFGETEGKFQRLKALLKVLGRVLILVDEAATAFGSVHQANTHETEKRLSGQIIAFMGDPEMFGKVVWVLMTSRPDELDPDILSRCPEKLPIFDPEGDKRKEFVQQLFKRKRVAIDESELDAVIKKTLDYSARNFDHLMRKVKRCRKKDLIKTVSAVLEIWQADTSIKLQRRYQTLVAVQNCSYPGLLPTEFQGKDPDEVQAEIDELKIRLRY